MTKIHHNPAISGITPYVPGKTEEKIMREHNVDKVIKLASNENPLGPSPKVQQAIIDAVHHIHRYPDDESPELRQKIANKWNLNRDQVIFGVGSSELIEMIFYSFVNPVGEFIITEHGFGLYYILGTANRAKPVFVKDNDFHQDPEAILAAITEDTRAIFMANPNNPTGTWIKAKTLKHFIERVPPHVVVVIDEAYVDYMTMPHYESMAHCVDDYPNLIVLHTFSKAYGLSGMRFGYSLSSASLAEQMNRARKPFNLPSLTLAAANAAIDDQTYIEHSVANNDTGLAYLGEQFDQLGIEYIDKSANFITIKLGSKANDIAQQLQEQGIVVRPLTPYKMSDYLRVTVGTVEENQIFIRELTNILGQST
ncbi:MAG: histidinol-phosphate transaminase [Coxiellaceae bacterium]|nr:histidinol-phosphate transaminase [Coxiellaceae bacterium]